MRVSGGRPSLNPETDPVCDRWKEIANYLGTSVRNAQRWAKERGLPVHPLPGKHRVIAAKAELDAWRASQKNPNTTPDLEQHPLPARGAVLQAESPVPGGDVPVCQRERPITNGDAFVSQDASPGPVGPQLLANNPSIRKNPAWRYCLMGSIVIATGILLTLRFREPPLVQSGEPKPTPLTTNAPQAPILTASISPDGQHVAYSDGTHLYVRPINTANPHVLQALPFSKYLTISWFPGGDRLLVSGIGAEDDVPGLWVLSALVPEFRQLRKGVERGAVSPDGSAIAFISGDGHHVGVMGTHGEGARLILDAADEDTFNELAWSADGAWVLVGKLHLGAFDLNVSIESIRPGGGEAHVLVAHPSLRSMCAGPNGRIVYAQAEAAPRENDVNLWEIRMDRRTGASASAPRRITNWTDATSVHGLSITADGHRLTFLKGPYQADVHIGELADQGKTINDERRLTMDDRDDLPTAITPDGKVVFFHSNRTGTWQEYRQETSTGKPPELLTSGPNDYRGARLSPDGKWLMYFDRPQTNSKWSWASRTRLLALPLQGGAPVSLSERSLTFINARCARESSGSCVLSERDPLDVVLGNVVFYSVMPGKGRGRELTRTRVGRSLKQHHWDLSPDGSLIAMLMDSEAGNGVIRVLSLKGDPPRDVIVHGRSGLQSMDWSADGQGWYVSSRSGQGAQLLYIEAKDGHAHAMRYQAGSFGTWAFPSADGRVLAFLEWSATGNIWMAEGLSIL